MLERALAEGVPAAGGTGDAVSGRDRHVPRWLAERHVPHGLAVKGTEPLWRRPAWRQVAAKTLAADLAAAGWQRVCAGDGAQGSRISDWTRVPSRAFPEPGWACWLLVRRRLAAPTDLAYSVGCARTGTPLVELGRVAGTRWAIAASVESAQGEVGLDQDEVRRRPGG